MSLTNLITAYEKLSTYGKIASNSTWQTSIPILRFHSAKAWCAMYNIRVLNGTGKLFSDFKLQNIFCREQTTLVCNKTHYSKLQIMSQLVYETFNRLLLTNLTAPREESE